MMSNSQSNQKANQEIELLMELMDTLDEGVLVVYEDKTPYFSNKRLNDIFGLSDADSGYATPPDLLDRIDRTLSRPGNLEKIIDRCVTEKESQKACFNLVDGTNVEYKVKLHPLSNQKTVFICTFRASRKHTSSCCDHSIFRQVVENIGIGIWLRDRDQLVYTNPAIKEIFGLATDEVPDYSSFTSILHPNDRQKVKDAFQSGDFKEKGKQHEIYRIILPDGKVRWIESDVFPIYSEQGELARTAGIDRDITEIMTTRLQLQETNEKLQKIIQSTPDSIVITDLEGNITYCNKETATLYEAGSVEELNGINAFEMVCEEDRNKTIEYMNRVLEEGTVKNISYRIQTKNNHLIDIEASVSTLNDKQGKARSFIAISKDVSRRKNAEQLLWMSERKFRNIFHNAHDAIFLIDTKGYSLDSNKRARELTGYKNEESPVLHFSQVIAPEYHAESEQILQNLIQGAQPGTYEKEIITKDQQRIPVELTATPLRNNGGEVIAIVSIARDIRERKNFERQLIEAKQKAEESDRLKSAFLANMSHEIRTPMNGIVGFSNILKRQELSETKRDRFINIINSSAEQLLNIINDIIDISKLETGQQKIIKEQFNLNEMLKETHALFRSQSKEKGIKLVLHQGLIKDTCTIHTDKTKLQQILHNLIGNALKFTSRGRVEFGYEKANTRLRFYVRDTGKGIPEEMHEKIFERFMQVYDQESVALGGTGLGLSISKGLVGLLGGSIDVQSEPGKGTLFHFDIPCQPDTSHEPSGSNGGSFAANNN